MLLVGDDGRHIELHAVQIELAAAAGNFPLHSRAEIVDVKLCDLPWILSGLDVDVPELHGYASLLPQRFARGAPRRHLPWWLWQDEQKNLTDILGFTAFLESRISASSVLRRTVSSNAGLPFLTCAPPADAPVGDRRRSRGTFGLPAHCAGEAGVGTLTRTRGSTFRHGPVGRRAATLERDRKFADSSLGGRHWICPAVHCHQDEAPGNQKNHGGRYHWGGCVANGAIAAWRACRHLPKRTPSGPIGSASAWSRNSRGLRTA
jgi:hypothetical protein